MGIDIRLEAIPTEPITVFDANITHNVRNMWIKAGIYDAIYNAEGKNPSDVLETLKAGLADMESKPDEYKRLDAPNGWGRYIHALPWLQKLVAAFEANPKATIRVSK